jgi:adenosyl cobinamide kinase/adenosyl cobinamide phosphate guanylyltransferase
MSERALTLLLGGARAGKSTRALALASGAARVLFVATAEARDDEMTARIAAHRLERPAHWDTLEEPTNVAAALAAYGGKYDVVVVDCLTLWVSNLMAGGLDVPARVEELIESYRRGDASWIVVSNEVGMGIVPDNALARTYRDALGTANRLVAAAADHVELLVAGLPVRLK